MFKELINKLRTKKKLLQSSTINNNFETRLIKESNSEIIVSSENSIYKIEINDYLSIDDYIKKMKSSEEYWVLDLICNCVLWNSRKQKVNKGTYYVITIGNCIYNILFTDEKIEIDERTRIDIDVQTQKENIIQERVITLNINKNEYYYFSAKHDKTGDTFYTRYYNKNRLHSFGALDLSVEEAYDEIKSVIYNLESIEGIENILDIELLKQNIFKDFDGIFLTKKKSSILKTDNIDIIIENYNNLFENEHEIIKKGALTLLENGNVSNFEEGIIVFATIVRGLKYKKTEKCENGEIKIIFSDVQIEKAKKLT